MTTENLLIEIGVEELPADQQPILANAFETNFANRLNQQDINFKHIHAFVTPRRLGVFVEGLQVEQPAKTEIKRGPSVHQAYDANGKPTPAALGFAKSNHVQVDQLGVLENEQGSWLIFEKQLPGQKVVEILADILTNVVESLPVKKRMRWGDLLHEFIRPVHWLVAMLGHDIVPWQWAGIVASNKTYGHRFHHPNQIELTHANDYVSALKSAQVIVNFAQRKKMIQDQILSIANTHQGEAIIPPGLVDEVTGLVEWPKALSGNIDNHFLALPKEVLITVLQNHQKCFAMQNTQGELLPYFIFISNIESKDQQQVINGNERVIRPRLSDADFFYHQDKKVSLRKRVDQLKQITYQAKLGSLFDKTSRLALLGQYVAEHMHLDETKAKQVCELAKTDLTTEMVMEFPELQGLMGKYYAVENGESLDVAKALEEQYQPRYSGDDLPESQLGILISLVDKFDTLSGIFAIDAAPSGDKDPFGLRRAAIGLIRILIEKKLSLNLEDCFKQSVSLFSTLNLASEKQNLLVEELVQFCLERLRIWYYDQGMSSDLFQAVKASPYQNLYDFDVRMHAVSKFKHHADAEALTQANKRVANILAKISDSIPLTIDKQKFEFPAEEKLFEALEKTKNHIDPLLAEQNYTDILTSLTSLRRPIDQFFDDVMVMVDDDALRWNRLALIHHLRQLFLTVADVSKIQLANHQ